MSFIDTNYKQTSTCTPELYVLLPSTLSCLIIAPHRTMFSVSIKGAHTPATLHHFPTELLFFNYCLMPFDRSPLSPHDYSYLVVSEHPWKISSPLQDGVIFILMRA